MLKIINTINKNPVLTNIYWLLNGKVVTLLGGFIANVFIANAISPSEYGVYNYAWSLTAIIITIISLGVRDILIKELVETQDFLHKNILISSIFYVILTVSLLLLCISLGLSQFYFTGDLKFIFQILCFTYLQSPFIILSAFFESQTNAKPITIVTNISSVIAIITKVALAVLTKDIKYIALASVVEMIVYSVGILRFTLNNNLELIYFEVKVLTQILRKSFPLLLNGVFIVVYMKLNQLMINSLADDFEAGLFSLALKLSEIFYFIPVIINSSIYPNAILLKEKSHLALEAFLFKWYRVVTVISIFIATIISCFSGFIVSTLYSKEYEGSAVVLQILVWTLLPVSVGVIRNSYIYALGLNKIQLRITLLSVILNLGLNFLLIPSYGAFGCALSLLLTQFLVGYVFNFLFRDLIANGLLIIRAFVPFYKANTNE